MSSPPENGRTGRLTGKSVLDLQFRIPFGTDVSVGEILVGTEEGSGRRFLVRVVDLRHGAEASSDDWEERTAGSMIRLDREGQAYELHDRASRLYQVALATPLGFLDAEEGRVDRLRKPKNLPWHFAVLRRPKTEDLAFLSAYRHDIELGFLRSGAEVLELPVGVSGDALAHHIGVFATTGLGKSNLMKTLAASLMGTRRYGLLLFDPHGEYYDGGSGVLPDGRNLKGLKDAPEAAERLAVFSSRPLSGPFQPLRISAYEISVGDVKNIFQFSLAQHEALHAVRAAFGDAWLTELAERQVDELVADFGQRIQDVTFSVLKRRAERILGFEIVSSDPTMTVTRDVTEAVRHAKVALVDTSSLAEDEELLVSAVLARHLFQKNKSLYKSRAEFEAMPPALITMEEAQRVLARREGEASVFGQIAREGRKFKTGLCAITQQPKLIPEELLSQFNTFFLLGLADERDRRILATSAKQDLGPLLTEIQTLEPGEAILTSPFVPFAVPAKIHLYEDRLARTVQPAAALLTGTDGFY